MVGAHLECLVSAHDEADLAVLQVLEEANITSAAFLLLASLPHELEQLGAHLEKLLLRLFVGLDLHLLSQVDDRLEVQIFGLGGRIILSDIETYQPTCPSR